MKHVSLARVNPARPLFTRRSGGAKTRFVEGSSPVQASVSVPDGSSAGPLGRATLARVGERASGAVRLSDAEALALAEARGADLEVLREAARAIRDRAWGRTITYSPKVFLPVTNLCRNRCDYCSFRRSPGDAGEWTMTPTQIDDVLGEGRARGCTEALLCLGDKPESGFSAYRRTLASFGHGSTVDYLVWAGEAALRAGLLPHTNAGVLTRDDMVRLRESNVSLGLMLESSSERLCHPGMPHHKAPDKRPARRLGMLREAGELRIPFTTGILLGIGETRLERVESLLAIRALAEAHGHIQEVIVQSFRARPEIVMADAADPTDEETEHAIAVARLILGDEISVQAPPNLSPQAMTSLLDSGINDLGGISPVTPDYVNHRHPWPHLDALGEACAAEGHPLAPRLSIYPSYVEREGFLAPGLLPHVQRAALRLAGKDAS